MVDVARHSADKVLDIRAVVGVEEMLQLQGPEGSEGPADLGALLCLDDLPVPLRVLRLGGSLMHWLLGAAQLAPQGRHGLETVPRNDDGSSRQAAACLHLVLIAPLSGTVVSTMPRAKHVFMKDQFGLQPRVTRPAIQAGVIAHVIHFLILRCRIVRMPHLLGSHR